MIHQVVIVDKDADIYGSALEKAGMKVGTTLAPDFDSAVPALSSATIVVAMGPYISADVIRQCPNVRFIQALTTGTDSVQHVTAGRDIAIAAVKGIHGEIMSELAILQMLALEKNFQRLLQQQAERRWERHQLGTLAGKTAGILGIGQISAALASRLKAFDMTVIGFSSRSVSLPHFDSILPRNKLVEGARELDFLIVLVPLSDETRNIVDERVLNALKPTSFVINLARGHVLDEEALMRSLRSGGIAGASLDVFSQEPLAVTSELWTCPNLLITPHIGGYSKDYALRAAPVVVENVRRFIAGADARSLLYSVSE